VSSLADLSVNSSLLAVENVSCTQAELLDALKTKIELYEMDEELADNHRSRISFIIETGAHIQEKYSQNSYGQNRAETRHAEMLAILDDYLMGMLSDMDKFMVICEQVSQALNELRDVRRLVMGASPNDNTRLAALEREFRQACLDEATLAEVAKPCPDADFVVNLESRLESSDCASYETDNLNDLIKSLNLF
jgi:hypothetical protein